MMAHEIQEAGYVFPYLYDESQAVAKAQGGLHPDPYLFDPNLKLVYRGNSTAAARGMISPHRPGHPRGHRRGVIRTSCLSGPETQHGLQHQVETGQRAGLRLTGRPPHDPKRRGGEIHHHQHHHDAQVARERIVRFGESRMGSSRWLGYKRIESRAAREAKPKGRGMVLS